MTHRVELLGYSDDTVRRIGGSAVAFICDVLSCLWIVHIADFDVYCWKKDFVVVLNVVGRRVLSTILAEFWIDC